ncbi:MAG: GNAT family N-acetyltransferase [Dokdonella sp.]
MSNDEVIVGDSDDSVIPDAVIHVELASWITDSAAIRHIRDSVFVVEQNVPENDEWDDLDALSVHVLARDQDGRAIGTGRLTPQQTIGRVAVLREWRGRHVGDALMVRLIDLARERRYPDVALHAQTHALAFYRRFGFVAEGGEFDECGIQHQTMGMQLEPFTPREAAASAASSETAADTVFDAPSSARAAVLDILRGTRNELAIFSHDLDPVTLDTVDALDELKRIAILGAQARIRVLIRQPASAVVNGHRLIALARRLPSMIAMRTPTDPGDLQLTSSFIVNDRAGFTCRQQADRFEGTANLHAPGRHRQLLELFEQVWARSEPSVELRGLEI